MRLLRSAVICLEIALLATPILLAANNDPAVDKGTPRIVCDEPTFQFGEKDQNELVTHTFKLKNEGDDTLMISKVKPACGCTVATLSGKILAPGETATLSTRLSLKGRRGAQRKSIRIESNDPIQPNYMLYLAGTAIVEIGIEPPHINFGQIRSSSPIEKEARLISRNGDARIIEVVGQSKSFKVEKADDANGNPTRLVVTALPPFEHGYWRDEFVVRTTHPDRPDIKMPVTAMVPEKIYVIPSTILLRGNHPEGLMRTVLIRAGTVTDYKVLGVEIPVEGVKVDIRPLGMGNTKIILQNIPVDPDLNHKRVTIKTDVPGKETISIPIRVMP